MQSRFGRLGRWGVWMWVWVGVYLHCTDGPPPHIALFISFLSFVCFPVLNELFNLRHIITEDECSEVAGQVDYRAMEHLMLVLAVKHVDTVDEATQVMKLYGFNTQRLHGELLHKCMSMEALVCHALSITCVIRTAWWLSSIVHTFNYFRFVYSNPTHACSSL